MRSCWGLVLLIVGCGSDSHPPPGADGDGDVDADADGDADPGCLDRDGDGAGIGGACAREDCDDTDPATIDECGRGCDLSPLRAGCPCDESVQPVAPCYMGPGGTAGVGTCSAGLKRCTEGGWSTCDGQTLPEVAEHCDGRDEDCDGLADDGVLSICGNCDSSCTEHCVGVGCDEGFSAEGGRNVVLGEDGSVTLDSSSFPQNFVIWIANSAEGTVSKVDTRTHEELGRYRTAWDGYPDPSRTTVNPHGDVVVANRQHGSATKILASGCPDRDGNGIVETSTGTDDVLSWTTRDDWADECIVWNVDGIPAARGSAFEVRAELDGGIHEYVWVGSYPFSDGTIYEIDADQGEKTGRELSETGAYGLAMAPGGILWSVGLGGCPVATDTTTLEQTRYSCPPAGGGAYGLAVDGEGRVWIGNATGRLDPGTDTWEQPLVAVYGGGITVDVDGNAYTGEHGAGVRIDGETMEVTSLPGMGGHGWAVDFDGDVWSIDMQTNVAHVLDVDSGEVTDVSPPFNVPYTYSDMTGFMLLNTIAPRGVYEHVIEVGPCDGPVSLHQFVFEADVPAGTLLSMALRSADWVEALAAEPWTEVGVAPTDTSPIAFEPALEVGDLVEVQVVFDTADGSKPTLASFALRTSCGP